MTDFAAFCFAVGQSATTYLARDDRHESSNIIYQRMLRNLPDQPIEEEDDDPYGLD